MVFDFYLSGTLGTVIGSCGFSVKVTENILLSKCLKLLNKFDQKKWMKHNFLTMQAHDNNQHQHTSVSNS
jgi:hypothetical protein